MAFRFDMQGKTPQQQIIVSKRDDEEKRRKQETAKRDAEKSIVADLSTHFIALAIDKEYMSRPRQYNYEAAGAQGVSITKILRCVMDRLVSDVHMI